MCRSGIFCGQGSAVTIAVVTTGALRTPHVEPALVSRITRSVVPCWRVTGCRGQSRGQNQWWHMVRVVSGDARVGATSRTVTRARRTRGAKYGGWRCGNLNAARKTRTRKVSPVKKILASEQISRTAPKKAVAVKTALRKALPTCEIQIPVEKWESITLDHMPGPKAESRNHVKRNCAKRRKDEFT